MEGQGLKAHEARGVTFVPASGSVIGGMAKNKSGQMDKAGCNIFGGSFSDVAAHNCRSGSEPRKMASRASICAVFSCPLDPEYLPTRFYRVY